MKTEIEVKFLDVDFADVRARLTQLGGVCEQPMRLMRRALIETPAMREREGFIRVRDEGDKVTLTYKQFHEQSLTGAQEFEVVVSDFDTTLAIFAEADLNYHTFQESKRETWQLGDVEVVLDEWPWLNPYIEIEGTSEQSVMDAADRLGFSWEDAVFGSVDVIYRRVYPNMTNRGVIDIKEVRFDDLVPPEFLGN